MSKTNGLTPKEKAFCDEYVLNGGNATRAYQKAYQCELSTANKDAWRVMKRERVKNYITALQKEAFSAACISAERVALKLADIAFADKGDTDYNATAQLKALDLLQKQLGLQKQKLEADVNSDINIVIEE